MTIRQRGSAYQVDIFHEGRRFRRNCSTEAEASALHAVAEDCLRRGVEVSAENAGASTVGTMRELYKLTHARHWEGSRNESNVKRNAEAVLTVIGEATHPKSVGQEEIDKLVEAFRSVDNSPGTINRKLAVLSKMLRFAHEREIIDRVPKIERFREEQVRIRWYSKAEEALLLDYLAGSYKDEHQDLHDLVVFLLDTGCRASEAGRAKWRDIDEVYFRVWQSKSGKTRTIPMTQRVREMLARRRASAEGDEVFPGWLDRKGTATRMSKAFTTARRAVGINDDSACLHACRHTFASRLVQSGVPLRTVQTLLGHSSINTTQRYAHLAPANLIDAVAMLERVTD